MANPFGGVTLFGSSQQPAQTAIGQQVRGFGDLALVVTVSGDPDHVRWWVEQSVGSARDGPKMIAGISSSIAPYVQPYYGNAGTGQIKGLLVGLAATSQYEELIGAGFSTRARENYIVQANVQLLLAGVVLVVGIGSIVRRVAGRRAPRGQG
jgi:hypothetical protein